MERTATPWRVLESPAPETEHAAAPVAATASPARLLPRPLWPAAAAGAAVLLVVAVLLLGQGGQPGTSIERSSSDAAQASASGSGGPAVGETDGVLVVSVAGAVLRPGLYRLPAGARVADAISAAGGYAPDLDPRVADATLNLAARLSDADQVRVPSRSDAPTPPAPTMAAAGSSEVPAGTAGHATPVDLNTATASELDALPGIGPATAAKIIGARDQAPFTSVQDLQSRKLVSSATFARLDGLVTVH